MNQTAERRELFVLDDLNIQAHGTFHKTVEDISGQEGNRIGLIFLNGLRATRSGHGDATAWWADCFAESGYSCFRLDLPAYGDSPGEPPEDWLGHINAGGYGTIAAAKIIELTTRFRLSGIVLVGQCAGAVTAIFAAAALSQCRGLILMEPYFSLPVLPSSEFRLQLHIWRLQSRIGAVFGSIYQRLKAIRLALRGSDQAETANAALLDRWKRVASAGVPILIMKAPNQREPSEKQVAGEFDYLAYIAQSAGKTSEVAITVIEGANHTFTNRLGRDGVRRRAEAWLNTHFPIATPEVSTAAVARSGLANKLAAKAPSNARLHSSAGKI